MAMFYTVKQGTSKQAWLGTVAVCECCNSQRPKDEFKVVKGKEVCGKCQEDISETV